MSGGRVFSEEVNPKTRKCNEGCVLLVEIVLGLCVFSCLVGGLQHSLGCDIRRRAKELFGREVLLVKPGYVTRLL